ncbi:GNAT family N-acetyltransferase [Planktothrix agardhii]|nr:GNAT family protein [Planktothrix agardhii]CAD5913897.1 putative N-acetyltransferase YnaD [Planktothrix agardhii]
MGDLVTKRLRLVPFKLPIVQAAMIGDIELGKVLGVTVLSDWIDQEFYDNLPEIANILNKSPLQGEWGWGNLVIQQAENTLIGHVMLKIIPDIPDPTGSPTGALEIGYEIAPSYRRQGYGSEATKVVLDWAFSQPAVEKVTAGCDADNIGSKRLLEKIGMQHTKTLANGQVLVWELSRSSWFQNSPFKAML